jgi:hypothetical protein
MTKYSRFAIAGGSILALTGAVFSATPALASSDIGATHSNTAASPVSVEQAQLDSALSQFRKGLTSQAPSDNVAAQSVARFDALTPAKRKTLALYLLGQFTPNVMKSTIPAGGGQQSTVDGDFQQVAQASDPVGPASGKLFASAATYSVHSTADESFYFAGILISRTRVWADYTTGSGVVKSVQNYGCQVLNNYDIFSTISTSKAGQSLSGGSATFLCNVVVKRGVPTPWGTISWSTRTALQYLSVNGSRVTGHGWR